MAFRFIFSETQMNDRIQQNRLWNFRQVVKAAGGNNAAADILKVRSSYMTQIVGPNPKRSIGDRMAEKIEAKFGLPSGTLDRDIPKQSSNGDPFIAEIVATLSHVSPADKEFVLGMTQWIAKRTTTERAAPQDTPGKIDLEGEARQLNYDQSCIDHVGKKEDAPSITSDKLNQRGENARNPKRPNDH
jgi:hypothetical protein